MKFIQINREFMVQHAQEFLDILSGWKYVQWTKDNLLFELPKKWELSFAVYSDDKLIGFCIGSNKIKSSYYLHLFFVSEHARGRQLGAKMFDHIQNIARKNNLTKIEFRCPESNTSGLDFYAKMNCKITSKIQDEISGNEADCYHEYDLYPKGKSYTIAEIGNNHNGSLEKALQLIDASATTGAEAVKFQSFRGIDIVSPRVRADEYKGWDVKNFEFWYQFIDTIALKLEDHQTVIDYTNKLGLDFITTPTSPYIVEFLETLKGIKAYKVASMDLNNFPLLNAIAKTGKEVIMSTGMGTMEEVHKAVEILKNNKLSILHCVSDYPLDPDQSHLTNILELKKAFPDHTIGFSDHSLGHELSIAARCMGALVFEKHITLDRKDPNPAEHHFAMEPGEFKDLVSWLRHIDNNLNETGFRRSETEQVNKFKYRRSYHFKDNFSKGHQIELNDLTLVRPGDGIGEDQIKNFVGRKLKTDVAAFDPCLMIQLE